MSYQKQRKNLLKIIIEKVLKENFFNESVDSNKLYLLHEPVRQEYQTPKDVGGLDHPGVMKIWEVGQETV